MTLAPRINRATGYSSRVAVAAVNLDGVGGNLHRHVSSEPLGVSRRFGVADTCIVFGGGFPSEHACSFDVRLHVGQHELNGLMLVERLTERLPFAGVLKGVFVRCTSQPRCVSGDVGSAHVEGLHGVHPTAGFRAANQDGPQVPGRHQR